MRGKPLARNKNFNTLGGYAIFVGGLAAAAFGLAREALQQTAIVLPAWTAAIEGNAAPVPAPSRVEKFKIAEAAFNSAPKVPVPRVLTAFSAPDVPVQVLALRLDAAETVEVKAVPDKRKKAARVAKADPRKKAKTVALNGKLPPLVVLGEVMSVPVQAAKKTRPGRLYAMAESTRDITNRSLGIVQSGSGK